MVPTAAPRRTSARFPFVWRPAPLAYSHLLLGECAGPCWSRPPDLRAPRRAPPGRWWPSVVAARGVVGRRFRAPAEFARTRDGDGQRRASRLEKGEPDFKFSKAASG